MAGPSQTYPRLKVKIVRQRPPPIVVHCTGWMYYSSEHWRFLVDWARIFEFSECWWGRRIRSITFLGLFTPSLLASLRWPWLGPLIQPQTLPPSLHSPDDHFPFYWWILDLLAYLSGGKRLSVRDQDKMNKSIWKLGIELELLRQVQISLYNRAFNLPSKDYALSLLLTMIFSDIFYGTGTVEGTSLGNKTWSVILKLVEKKVIF